ncbi:MAG: hypothetical protein H0U04_04095, partial [Rubrobacter sp.]|nr:hypothetical protein [Rubrobacter sp.]
MAVCDGELADREREFLAKISSRLEVPLDLDEIERRTRDYRETVKQSMAGRAKDSVRDKATRAGEGAKQALGKVLKRRTVPCSGCGAEVSAAYRFCPECGQSVVSESVLKTDGEDDPIPKQG